ncbi:MAG: NAD(P)/FAD-dependent oxidoreductase [Calditrichaeota bacterium]|nr:NAD(P)/FAD-dependent oxidoreductase [Calditrichota bacterium]
MAGDTYDVVIVGAGPAGSLAARSAANAGAKTLLLERDPVIGSPVRCGEGISGRNLARFVTIQDRWVARIVQGVILYAPNGTPVTVEGDYGVGYILERSLFDRYLAELAAEAGADVLSRADVDSLILDDHLVDGVTYVRFGKRHRVRAAVTIGADGVESRVGRWAGLHTQIRAADLESAYQFYLAGIDYDARYCHFYLGEEVAPGGYIWVFPKGENVAAVGIGVVVRDTEAGTAYRKLKDFVDRHYPGASIVGEMAGGVPVSRAFKNPIANGLLLAGDAARHCNPLTGGGIYTAMVAGFHAGQVAAQAAATGRRTARDLQEYNHRLEDEIVRPHQRAYRIKEGVTKLSDDALNRTAREINALAPAERSLKNIFLAALRSQPLLAVDVIRAFV